jgi:hypothetical protein
MDYADAAFEAQPDNRAWSATALERVQNQLRSVGINGSAACRDGLCRVEFKEGSEEVAKRHVDDFIDLGQWKAMITHASVNGATVVKLYLARPDVDLPEPDLEPTAG